jgi:hypothetical protein
MPQPEATVENCVEKDLWCLPDGQDDGMVYVNLNDNRENFTDYDGADVWNAIYSENCMVDTFYVPQAELSNTCSERTVLY